VPPALLIPVLLPTPETAFLPTGTEVAADQVPALGIGAGVTALEALDEFEVPFAFVAVIVKV
jgi:hypothetical protein